MKAPRIPSLFKSTGTKIFSFKPRYYDKRKERIKQMIKGGRVDIKFNTDNLITTTQKGRNYKIIFLIIILSLLAYSTII